MKDKKTTSEQITHFHRHLGERGINLLVDKHPTPEKLEEFNKNQEKAGKVVEFVKKAVLSKTKAFELLEKAYAKGDFDEIIKHLEEAKKLGNEKVV